MTAYVTVGLILGLGGYFALLLTCRTREQGVVVAEHPFLRYLRALAAAADAMFEQIRRFYEVLGLVTLAYANWPCANCGQPLAAHTAEVEFGLVCPIDSAARTENERFTYTRAAEWPA